MHGIALTPKKIGTLDAKNDIRLKEREKGIRFIALRFVFFFGSSVEHRVVARRLPPTSRLSMPPISGLDQRVHLRHVHDRPPVMFEGRLVEGGLVA
jgi:hypothetical protein